MADLEEPDATLRDQTLQGGFYLMLRQGLGMGIRVLGILVLAALLSPADYGVFVAPTAILILLGAALPIGIPTFLIREEREPPTSDLDVLFTWSVFFGTVIAAIAWLVFAASTSATWIDRDYALSFSIIATGGAFQHAQAAARVVMDRSFRFGERGAIELISDALIYLIAIPLAVLDFGFLAPAIGQATSSVWLGVAMLARSGFRPSLSSDLERFRSLARQGVGYAFYGLSNHLFDATILLVSGGFLGKVGAGQVGLAQRLSNRTVVLRVAVAQLSLAAVSKVQSDVTKLRRIQAESTSLHLLTTGIGISTLAYLGPTIVPLLFGEEWSDATPILAFLCLFQFVSLAFDMHLNMLVLRQETFIVTLQRLVQTGLTGVALLVLVPTYGASGVGPALMTGLLSFAMLERAIRRLFVPDHAAYAPFFFALLPLYLSPWLDGLARVALLGPLAVTLTLPRSRAVLTGFVGDLRRALRRSR